MVWRALLLLVSATAVLEGGQPVFVVGLEGQRQVAPSNPGVRTLVMQSKKGPFQCTIPDTSLPVARLDAHRTATATRTHLAAGCLSKTVDYWTYEVCPFSSIKQLHKEGTAISISIHLGEYDSSLDMEASGDEQPSYRQEYVKGQDGRQTVVSYHCPNAQERRLETPSFIREIHESTPLHYDIVVVTPHACSKHLETALSLTLALENGCSHLSTGWWTYRFCHLRSLTQFHQEKEHVLAEFDLGTFPPGVDRETYTVVVPDRDDPKNSYLKYWLQDGSECDVASRKRSTEVRMYCDPDESLKIKSVEETKSCVYQVTVLTRLLCENEAFELPVQRALEIACHPLDRTS